MKLESMTPNPDWEPIHDSLLEALGRPGLTYTVWGGDWCPDTRNQLPDFGAALEAAGVPEERIEHVPVDRDKQGPGVEEYGVEYIPTVVVERDGEELVRFVEEEDDSIAVYLGKRLQELQTEA